MITDSFKKMKFTINKEIELKICEMRQRANPLPTESIAKELNIKHSTVRYVLAKNKISLSSNQRKLTSSRRKISIEQEKDLIADRDSLSREELANKYGLTLAGVKSILGRNQKTIPMEARQNNAHESKRANTAKRLGKKFGVSDWDSVMEIYAKSKNGKLLGKYVSSRTKVEWECSKGHTFEMIPNSVQQGQWCPHCYSITSEGQKELDEYIRSFGFSTELNNKKIISPKHLDVYVDSIGVGFEYSGLFAHSTYFTDDIKTRHFDKAHSCFNKGIGLFAFYDDEWANKQDLIKAMVRWRLGKFNGIKVGARECDLIRLDNNNDFDWFFDRNHIDGHALASYGYGLFYQNKLICCASIRTNFANELEIARFATDYDYSVVGGFSKILRVLPRPLISYSNNRLSNGDVYKKNGFNLLQENQPSYWYTDFRVKIPRFQCKRINDPEVLVKYPDVSHTETDQALAGMFSEKIFGDNRALYKVYDYGHRKWLLKI